MPVIAVRKDGKIVGYKYGKSGKVYRSKKDAEKQGRAINISKKRSKKRKY
tara:strand:+ start:428 stop:577 length:150 start_codon:yes stop_codon:yes gene_type:complete